MMTKNYMNNVHRNKMILDTIDGLVPENHIVRQYEKAIDWSFIYDYVEKYYKPTGAPSIDPVVLFKMVFLNYLEGFNSMRKLCETIEVNIAYRWFLGLDFGDKVPNYSTFSQNLRRKFLTDDTELFDKIFKKILHEAIISGFVDPTSIYIDGTHVKASANKKKHVDVVVDVETKRYKEDLEKAIDEDREKHGKKPIDRNDDNDGDSTPREDVKSSDEMIKDTTCESVVKVIKNERNKTIGYETIDNETGETHERYINEDFKRIKQSTTDPDSGYYNKGEHEKIFAYSSSVAVDNNNFALAVAVRPGNVHDSVSFFDLLDKLKSNTLYDLMHNFVMDAGYKTPAIMKTLSDLGKQAILPYTRPRTAPGKFKKYEFVYLEDEDLYLCPDYKYLEYKTTNKDGYREYSIDKSICATCPLREKCTSSKTSGKVITRHVWADTVEECEYENDKLVNIDIYKHRKETVERCFADGKENFGLRYTRYRGIVRVTASLLLTFACINLKKIARWKRKNELKAA